MRFITLLAVVAILATVNPISSQRRPAAARIHAAVCVGEVGWDAPEDACASIVEVHMARARGALSPETVAQRFSAALRSPPPHRRWVRGLLHATETRAPEGWPSHLPWSGSQRYAALERYERIAAAVLAGEREPACPGCVDYGGLMDAVPRGMEEARRFEFRTCNAPRGTRRRCRPVAQVFYRRIQQSDSEDRL